MFKQQYRWWWVAGTLVLLLLALNFLSFRVAVSNAETNHTISTYRTGDTLPDNMIPDFTLTYVINSEDQLSIALDAALQAELESSTSVGTVTAVSTTTQNNSVPFLLVELTPDRFWSPFYGHATVTAQLFYACDGQAPWPLDEPIVLEDSPAIMAEGEFTLIDSSWGIISKPAYNEYLAQKLAEEMAAALQKEVFQVP